MGVDDKHWFTIRYKPENSTVRVDRTRSGGRYDIVHVRDFPVRDNGGEVKLRIIMDYHSVEVFVNDGEQAASCKLFSPASAEGVRFSASGSVCMDVEHFNLVFDNP